MIISLNSYLISNSHQAKITHVYPYKKTLMQESKSISNSIISATTLKKKYIINITLGVYKAWCLLSNPKMYLLEEHNDQFVHQFSYN